MNLPNKRHGFTLIELLVVISIIGILASLAIPAVSGALTRGQMTQTLNNVRQLHLATQTMDLDNTAAGVGGGFPGTQNPNMLGYTQWIEELQDGNYLTLGDLRKLLSAERLAADEALGAASIALNLYDTTDTTGLGPNDSEAALPFLSTKNWDGTAPTVAPEASVQPYGNKGVVVMRRGGEGSILQPRLLDNPSVAGPAAAGKL
jgi:prepilin-type N-terminal cleavage/methylation domain-containing protein